MTDEARALEALRKMTATAPEIITGKVFRVNEQERTCDIDLLDGRVRFGVHLQASAAVADGVLMVPKDGAMIVAGQLNGSKNYSLVNADAIDKIIWKIGSQTFEMTEDGFEFNGGSKGAMVVIASLVQQLNRLEQKMSTHQHAYVSPGGPAVTTPDPGGSQLVTPLTTVNDLANNDITQ
jgi:hypothetical protein